MQQKILHGNFRYVRDIDCTEYSAVVWERKEKLEKFQKLREEGCSEATILEVIDVKRSTFFRWKKKYKLLGLAGLEDESKRPNNVRKTKITNEIEQKIYHLCKKFPLWGKSKIAVRYKTEHNEKLSQSAAGRVMKKLRSQGKINSVRFMYGKKDTKRRIFNGHAKRWKYGMQAQSPGELIQVDHMTVVVPGFGELKHFNAVCPTTKYAVYKSYKTASSHNAADFLEHMKAQFPFPITSIQVDGGSEFMGDFEKACQTSNIPLWVLPPRSPEHNGNVERSNGTAKYEFYSQYEGGANLHMINKNLQKFADFYNKIRPHQGIGLLTPSQFFESMVIGP
jgi:putative transposase